MENSDAEGRFIVGVGAVVEHTETGRVLLLKRTENVDWLPGIWEDIVGKMKQFEQPEDALRREVREESGLEIEILKPLNVAHFFHGERSASNEEVLIVYWCKSHSDRVMLSHEHTDYRWTLPQEALQFVEHQTTKDNIKALIAEVSHGSS